MTRYELSPSGATWQETQDGLGNASETLFDFHAGDEVSVFSDAMALLHACFLEEAVNSATSPETKICIGMLSQAYQQLVSCWTDLRQGRLASAINQWRSVWEAQDYVIAAGANASFAKAWADPNRQQTIKPERARKIAKGHLNAIRAKDGDAWATRRSGEAAMYRPYSHFSSAAARLTILKPDPSMSGYFLTPEGAYSPQITQAAKHTALLALDAILAASLALNKTMEDAWHATAMNVLQRGHDALKREGAYT